MGRSEQLIEAEIAEAAKIDPASLPRRPLCDPATIDAYLATPLGSPQARGMLDAIMRRTPATPAAAEMGFDSGDASWTIGSGILSPQRRPSDPTQDEIAQACDRIRSDWSEKERKKRMIGRNDASILATFHRAEKLRMPPLPPGMVRFAG